MILISKRTVFSHLILFLILGKFLLSPALADETRLIFSGTPPGGEIYFTGSIACSNLDGIAGDEIIITDDFGSYQILGWDKATGSFTEIWVSDPIFETNRVKEIFAPNIQGENPFLIFRDTANNLRIFNKQKYIFNDIGEIFFDGIPASDWINDFVIGEFDLNIKGWELVTLRCGSVEFGKNRFTYGIINTGNFTPELRQQSSEVIFNISIESSLEVEYSYPERTYGLLIIPNSMEHENIIRIHRTWPPFDNYDVIEIHDITVDRLGWAGQIRKSGDSYISAFIRNENEQSKIYFINLDDVDAGGFQVTVPSNTSKWILGDLDSDGIRELVLLDFLSQLHIYDLSGNFPLDIQS